MSIKSAVFLLLLIPKIIYASNDLENDKSQQIHLAVLLPSQHIQISDHNSPILSTTLPVIELAIQEIKNQKLLEGFDLIVHARDTLCSSTYGPLEAFDLISRNEADVFIGPVCDYVLAPVSRYASVWQRPVITTGGIASAFNNKQFFPTLIRMVSIRDISNVVSEIIEHYKFQQIGFFLNNFDEPNKGHSECSHVLSSLKHLSGMESRPYEIFEKENHDGFKLKLKRLRESSKVIIMCANPESVREIMLVAEELDMVDSGEYVFISIEVSENQTNNYKPWYDTRDTEKRNKQAEKAYRALLKITSRKQENKDYEKFTKHVKALAKEKYNYTFNEDESVNQFISGFYDGILLYAKALNELLKVTPKKPFDNKRLTELIKETKFRGITGDVSLDASGDRLADFSLYSMNSKTSKFEVIASYEHNSKLSFVEGKEIHWKGVKRGEKRTRDANFNNETEKSEDETTNSFAILSLVLGVSMFVMGFLWFVSSRRYRNQIQSLTPQKNFSGKIPLFYNDA